MEQELENELNDCHAVRDMTQHPGWMVLESEIKKALSTYSNVWMKMDKSRPEFDELRVSALALQQMLDMVNNFEVHRRKLEEAYIKLQNPKLYVPMDVDNDTILKED